MVNRSVESLRQSAPEARLSELRAERQFLHQLRNAIREPLDPTPGDFGLDRMRAEIDRLQARQRRERIGARLKIWWRRFRHVREGAP